MCKEILGYVKDINRLCCSPGLSHRYHFVMQLVSLIAPIVSAGGYKSSKFATESIK